MGQVRRFLALSPGERWAIVGAALLIGTARIGLRLLSFRRLQRVLGLYGRGRSAHPLTVERLGRAVAATARRLPGPNTCLVQALAAQALFARHGHVAELRIGVARAGDGIEAHAWLEQYGRPIFGESDPLRHTVLPHFDSGSA